MQHPDPDDLALYAVSSTDDAPLVAHLDECADCRSEVAVFREVGDLGRLSNYGEAAPRPGEHVWLAIAAELGFDEQVDGAVAPARLHEPHRTAPAAALRSLPTGPPAPPGPPVTDTGVAAPTQRRRPRWLVPLAALVIGAALGAGAVAVAQRSSSDTVEAVAELTAVPNGPLTGDAAEVGRAQLVSVDRTQRVVVDAADLPAIPGAYEVWLFGNDGRMVSLGSLDHGVGSFTVPQGISTSEYRTVDVSDEPSDGNPGHSGISVVRGSFS